jgi:effector-binding domain-containing protein
MDPTGNRVREAGDYLIGFSHGYYGELDDLADRLDAFVKENSLTLSGPVFTLYLHDELCMRDPSQYLAQVCVAVSKDKKKARRATG